MKNYNLILAAFVLSLGLVASAYLISNRVKKDRTVIVKGLSEKEVSADKVIWPIVYKIVSNQLGEVNTAVNSKNKQIEDFLLKNGITKEEISISAADIIDLEADRYINTKPPFRYNITSVIIVTSTNVDLVRKLITNVSELGKEGIAITATGDYRYNVQYVYTKLNDVKPLMVEEATKNARITAEKFAKDSESKLGKIKTASQGQIYMADRDANTPHLKTLRVVSTIEYYLND